MGARAEVVPKEQCDKSYGFSALRQQSQEAGARVAALLGSCGAGLNAAPSFRPQLSLPA